MKSLVIGVLILLATSLSLGSCSSKLCPAYGSNPKSGHK